MQGVIDLISDYHNCSDSMCVTLLMSLLATVRVNDYVPYSGNLNGLIEHILKHFSKQTQNTIEQWYTRMGKR